MIDWGARVNAYPMAWHPAILGVWDWGHAIYVAAGSTIVGRLHMAFTTKAPGVTFTTKAPEMAFTTKAPGMTFR